MFRVVLLASISLFLILSTSTCGCLPIEFDFQNVDAIAIYEFASPYGGLSPEDINFNITEPQVIDAIMAGIDFGDVLDGHALGTRPEAFIYFRDSNGNVEEGRIVCVWFRLLIRDEWRSLFCIEESSSEIMKQYIQP